MLKRGPDAHGEWIDASINLALAHRRLAILDLSPRANQPFSSDDGQHLIVFNGEIYNHKSIASDLAHEGVRLRTSSDTEVILELYRLGGVDALSRLRGMFALAIWDSPHRRLILARDPYGIKPLYYSETSEGILFASQVRAIAATELISSRRDMAGVLGFYVWGSVPEPFTYLRDVKPVPAGGLVVIEHRQVKRVTVVEDIGHAWATEKKDHSKANIVQSALADAVEAHLLSDVPVGLLLSGGVDSGVIAGLASDVGVRPQAITMNFDNPMGHASEEVGRAKLTANRYGLPLSIRTVVAGEFAEDLPSILSAMDQPSVDGVNTWYACKAVAEAGLKVVLSGVGGDELFCGYDSFRRVPQIAALGKAMQYAGSRARPLFSAALNGWAIANNSPKAKQIADADGRLSTAYRISRGIFAPNEVRWGMDHSTHRDALQRLRAAEDAKYIPTRSTTATISALESAHYLRNQLLRDSDWASMAHSVELRTPLVDRQLLGELAPFCDAFTNGRGKLLMASAPRKPLPAAVSRHRKTGFGLPLEDWWRSTGQRSPSGRDGTWPQQWARIIGGHFGL